MTMQVFTYEGCPLSLETRPFYPQHIDLSNQINVRHDEFLATYEVTRLQIMTLTPKTLILQLPW